MLFGSGIAMGFLHGHALQIARRLHGPASVIWLLLLGLHVLVYARRATTRAAQDVLPAKRQPVRGTTARVYAIATVVTCGVLLGAATVPAQHRWIDIARDHHDREHARGSHTSAVDELILPCWSTVTARARSPARLRQGC